MRLGICISSLGETLDKRHNLGTSSIFLAHDLSMSLDNISWAVGVEKT